MSLSGTKCHKVVTEIDFSHIAKSTHVYFLKVLIVKQIFFMAVLRVIMQAVIRIRLPFEFLVLYAQSNFLLAYVSLMP